MSDQDPNHPLRIDLIATQQHLQESLEEVCTDVDVESRTTDELIQIEETLAVANQAAKEVVSLRRKLRAEQGAD